MGSSRGSSPSLSPASISPIPRADDDGRRARPLLLNEDLKRPLLLGEGSRADRPLLRGRSHNLLTVTHRPLPTNSGLVCLNPTNHSFNLSLSPTLLSFQYMTNVYARGLSCPRVLTMTREPTSL